MYRGGFGASLWGIWEIGIVADLDMSREVISAVEDHQQGAVGMIVVDSWLILSESMKTRRAAFRAVRQDCHPSASVLRGSLVGHSNLPEEILQGLLEPWADD